MAAKIWTLRLTTKKIARKRESQPFFFVFFCKDFFLGPMRLVSGVLGVAWLGVVGGSARCGGGRAGFRAFFFRGPFPKKKKKPQIPARPSPCWCWGWLSLVLGVAWLGVGGGNTHIYIYKQTVLKLLERPAGARPKKNFLQKKTKKKTTATLFSLLFSW